jgi:hypothetical protein
MDKPFSKVQNEHSGNLLTFLDKKHIGNLVNFLKELH